MSERILDGYIGTQLLWSGWAAVHYVKVEQSGQSYWDIQQTGIGRYKTQEEATKEAKQWSEGEGIRFGLEK
jgi:hypothetical protein